LSYVWLDPRDAGKWGEAGKYWQHNVAEAKAMLTAAGFKDGMSVVLNQSNRAHGTPEQAQIIAQDARRGRRPFDNKHRRLPNGLPTDHVGFRRGQGQL
jgi:hypothetical protein